MGNSAQNGFAGGNPLSGASGTGTMTPMNYGSSPMIPAGGLGGGPSQYQPQMQAYAQYLSQALPSINNAWAAGTLPQGQMPSNFQTPQSFGLPGTGGSGGMMPGGSMGGGGMPGSGGHK